MSIWHAAPPADPRDVSELRQAFPSALQDDYFSYLLRENGGEGDLGVEPGWIQLWPAEEVAHLNAEYCVSEFLPGFVGIGSDGGGNLFAVDVRAQDRRPICCVPFIPMDAELAEVLAPDFSALEWLFAKEFDADTPERRPDSA